MMCARACRMHDMSSHISSFAEQMNVRVGIISVARGISHASLSSFYSRLRKHFLQPNAGYIKQYVLVTDIPEYAQMSSTMKAALPDGIKVVYLAPESKEW